MGICTSRNYSWSNKTVSLRNWHLLKWALDNYLFFSVLLRYFTPLHFSSCYYSAENAIVLILHSPSISGSVMRNKQQI